MGSVRADNATEIWLIEFLALFKLGPFHFDLPYCACIMLMQKVKLSSYFSIYQAEVRHLPHA